MSRWLLKISRDGQSATPLGNLCVVKKCFLMLGGITCVPVCAHCLFSWHWAPLGRAGLHLHCTLPSGIYRHWDPPKPHLCWTEQSQLPQPFLVGEGLQFLRICSLCWTLSSNCLLLRSPRTALQVLPHQSQWNRGEAWTWTEALELLVMCYLLQTRMLLPFLTARVYASWLSIRTLRSFSAELLGSS